MTPAFDRLAERLILAGWRYDQSDVVGGRYRWARYTRGSLRLDLFEGDSPSEVEMGISLEPEEAFIDALLAELSGGDAAGLPALGEFTTEKTAQFWKVYYRE